MVLDATTPVLAKGVIAFGEMKTRMTVEIKKYKRQSYVNSEQCFVKNATKDGKRSCRREIMGGYMF